MDKEISQEKKYYSISEVSEICEVKSHTLRFWEKEFKDFPKGAVYKVKKINKKVRKLALAQTLSKKNSDKSLHILADVKKEIKKTKEFNKFLKKNKIINVLIISDSDSMKNINKSARNIKNVKLIKEEGTNIYDLFKYKNVIMTSSSVKKIQERVLNEKN